MDISVLNAPAAWDLLSFLQNAKGYIQTAGGALLMLVGVVLIIWAGVKFAQHFLSEQGKQTAPLHRAVIMLIAGGAMAGGGFTLLNTMASGGQTTIEQLGGGAAILFSALPFIG